jgi:hypothetical protein
MTADVISVLCAATCAFCFALLLRGYLRMKTPILFWSSASFLAFTVANLLFVADTIVFPTNDLSLLRNGASLVAIALLIYGLVTSLK